MDNDDMNKEKNRNDWKEANSLYWGDKVKAMYDGWQGSVVVMWLAILIGCIISGVGLFITDVAKWTRQGTVLYVLMLAPGVLAWLYGLYSAITVDRKNKDLDAAGYFLWFYPFAYVGGTFVGGAAITLVLALIWVILAFIGKIFQILFM